MSATFELIAEAVVLNAALATVAYWRKAVTASGAAAGFLVGTAIIILSGWTPWFCMGAFVVTSSVASRVGSDRKSHLSLIQDKGGRRDAFQVLANGGAGLLAAAGWALFGSFPWLVALVAAFAEANADTWSSELGVLSRRKPVSIVTRRRITPGMSGGVTAYGFALAAAGSLVIAIVFAAGTLIFKRGGNDVTALLWAAGIITLAGWLGSVADSLLGATLQPLYLQPRTGDLTERRQSAGGRNARVRGVPFFTNDVVNFLSTAIAAAAAAVAAAFIPGLSF